ncbi:MAG: SAM-dependent methyltransferase [Prevotellaceae bacterium]|jgi:16S rRNA (cytidine1402-2'-O)-methyltransferase|nr:SAM-dependent methyltransferase [Prevotellaceae bacterium]
MKKIETYRPNNPEQATVCRPGKLYLIPAPIGAGAVDDVIPQGTLAVLRRLTYFVVEELRTARRYLSKAGVAAPIDTLTFFTLNEHTAPEAVAPFLQPALEGNDIGLLSEAGVPAVADPGAVLVRLAHAKSVEVVPLVGPSSLLLALMASGLNGQSFAFAGYLPVKPHERQQRIKHLERLSASGNQTQLFIETPYRNLSLFAAILESAAPGTLVCVAANLTQPDAFVHTASVAEWKAAAVPDIHKKPCIFLLLASNAF